MLKKYESTKVGDLISAKHLAKTFGTSRQTVNRWMKELGLPYVRLANERYVLEADFMEWFQNQRTEQGQ